MKNEKRKNVVKGILVSFLFLFFINFVVGEDKNAFITKWKVSDNDGAITIPTFSGEEDEYLYNVNWGDGSTDEDQTEDAIHEYKKAGTYTITITGQFPRFFCDNDELGDDLMSVEQWGTGKWTNMQNAFHGCTHVVINAQDTPDLSECETMSYMFAKCKKLGTGNGNWDWNTTTITNMNSLFSGDNKFNGNISKWDISNVTNTVMMFATATSFNQDLSKWETGNVEDMSYMFMNAISFNQDIGKWDTTNTVKMRAMFHNALQFNQNIGAWNVEELQNCEAFLEKNKHFSTQNYDALLIGWSKQKLQQGLTLNVGKTKNSEASKAAKESIISNFKWTIIDGNTPKK